VPSLPAHASAGKASCIVIAGENLSSSLQALDFGVDKRQDVGFVHGCSLDSQNKKRLAVAISTIVLVSEFGIIGCYRLSAAVLGMFGIRKFFVIFAVSAAVGGRLHLCTLSPRANMKLHD